MSRGIVEPFANTLPGAANAPGARGGRFFRAAGSLRVRFRTVPVRPDAARPGPQRPFTVRRSSIPPSRRSIRRIVRFSPVGISRPPPAAFLWNSINNPGNAHEKATLPFTLLFTLLAAPVYLLAQTATQTVRGKITDAASKSPIPGASLLVVNSNPPLGTSTDPDGNFRLAQVPVGRISLRVTFLATNRCSSKTSW
jgi:hypothetical protein